MDCNWDFPEHNPVIQTHPSLTTRPVPPSKMGMTQNLRPPPSALAKPGDMGSGGIVGVLVHWNLFGVNPLSHTVVTREFWTFLVYFVLQAFELIIGWWVWFFLHTRAATVRSDGRVGIGLGELSVRISSFYFYSCYTFIATIIWGFQSSLDLLHHITSLTATFSL